MAALNCVSSKDNGREYSQPHTDQPAEKTLLPPFSGELRIDEKLKFSKENFKQTINDFLIDKYITLLSQLTSTHDFLTPNVLVQFASKAYTDYEKLKLSHESFKQTFDDFLKDKNITPLSQLTATPAFPTPYVLAQFASKAYTDYNRRQTDAQYEILLALPDGWKLLTTASNTVRNNGYFGAAYWHPENQQVVIAHRGTDPKKWGPLWTDIQGVLRNKYVGQMESANTFAHQVTEVLRQVDKAKGTHFQVFFTGHSLGGWLAQITTFTTEYLKTEDNTFLKIDNVPHSYHPHTVVFDSPGCKDMLLQMADKFDVRLDGRSIYLDHLDITSYLSAPNRINTCNKHAGTVYRVFSDLSDMGWWEKHTALYNLAAHSVGKIVEVFDPETGQVYRDEQGKLKVQVVIDWPISGFRRDEEYKRFFKWAEHLNNYNPDIKTEILELKGYHPIRYQTKNCDERVTSISIFSQEERQFLEDYRRLCQLPELFKPKDMFTAIGNNQVQEEAEEKLQSFGIENETISCTDVSALQAHITYVKRLLQLFPEIKENTKCALSPHQIRNNVYQIATKRYLEKLHQSPLDFKPDALSLTDFLNSEEQKVLHLRMDDGDARTGLIKVYQVLQKTHSLTDFLSEGHYTVLTLQHLLLVNPMVNLNTLMESTTTPHLLMMACETGQQSNDETKQIFESLFNTLSQKPSVKIILTTQAEDNTVTFLQDVAKGTLSNGLVTRYEQLTWSDLTPSLQETLLENAVNFQGSEFALNQLISPDSPVTNFLPLADLLGKEHVQFGEDHVAYSKCNCYDETYYIDRTLHQQVVIKQDILNDNGIKMFPDLLASTEQEFKQLCQLNPKINVHWIDRNKSGKLVWQQSEGSLDKLRKYIDTHSSHTYTADDLDKLLEQAQHQRMMLISDTAGMGKSTVLTHLSKQIKQKFPTKWVVRIDLNDHTNALQALQEEQIDREKAIEFVSEKLLKLEPGLEMELFKQCCEQKQKVDIVIMLDGFDEVSLRYKETVIALLQALRQTAVEQLWVTTRPHLREELEDELQQLSYTLEPFSEENQVEFLTRFWSLNKWFTEMDSKEKEEQKVKLEIYAEQLINKLAQSISDKDKEFTGIPLQCRMLAEAFDEEVKTFCQSATTVPELPFSLDLIGLYDRFLKRKYDICVEEKSKISKRNVGAEAVRKDFVKNIIDDYQILALKTLFAVKQLTLLQINSQCTSSGEDLTRTGIVQISYEGKLHFIHRTFAEYYVAEFLVNRLTKGSNTSQQVQDLILQKIFLEGNYSVIRVFIDGLLSRSEPSQEVLKQYGNRIHDLCTDGVPILHPASSEGNAYIVGFLLDSVQAGEHTDIVHGLLVAHDKDRDTAWDLAAMRGHVEVLVKLWECATENLSTGELINILLFSKRHMEHSLWHYSSLRGKVQLLDTLWKWAKEKLTKDELNNKILLAKNDMGQTAWHVAAFEGNVEILQKLWECGKETLTAEELYNKLFFAKEIEEQTAWHYALLRGNVEALQTLWECGKEILTAEELRNKLLLAEDKWGQTAWRQASSLGKVEAVQKLWEWGKETLTAEELNSKLLLANDNKKRTAWHYASLRGNVEVLQKLWECGKETLTAQELYNNLLFAKDDDKQTAWHYASLRDNVEVLQKLWECGKETLKAEELYNKLLLAKDHCGQTVWHVAAEEVSTAVLEKLYEWAKEAKIHLRHDVFLAKNNDGKIALELVNEEDYIMESHRLKAIEIFKKCL